MSNPFETILHELSEIRTLLLESKATPPVSAVPDEEILTEKEAAKFLKCSRQTLKTWRDAGNIQFSRVGTLIRYRKSDLLQKRKGVANA